MIEMKKSKGNVQAQACPIVVKKVSIVGRVFDSIMDLIYRISKLILWIVICLVISIGIIAILNPTIRETVLSYLPFIN